MLTLISGVPGTGKTAAGVDLLLDLLKSGNRPLFVIELPEENVAPLALKLPHTLLGPGDAERWHEVVPDNAIVYMPEAQRLWPARSPSAKVPAHVEAVGQHRHRGIDIVIDTQGPKLLDDKVRLRVGRHIHLRDLGLLGRHWYEGNECWDINQWRSAPIKTRYRLPKRALPLYTSATTHVKPVRKLPPVLLLFAILIPLLCWAGYRVYSSIASKVAHVAAAPGGTSGAASSPSGRQSGQQRPVVTAETLVERSIPRLPDEPLTAPMFDDLRVVVAMPRIAGGYCLGAKCRCFLQRGYRAPISDAACARIVADPPFDPYMPSPDLSQPARSVEPVRADAAGPPS